MLQEVRPDYLLVHDDTSVIFDRRHAPHEEDALQQPVEWNNFDDVEREEFDDREASEDHPVGQPFSVVGLVFRFDSFHRDISGVGDSNDVADDLSCISEGKVQSDEADDS